ncbi:hypothetical protein [Deinococcus sp. Leaf326]|uniref:hypothetical protein n=1 Tax=Deinococcus sp. Leaf326 TaxID=1736338 RepID=UPI0006F313A7|nr:hypothetical protein [Deinococcus sp. Leaf326]KQR25568.1 hypothetical protein ASF71_18980 [Deinococcus sp. Leaf326]
MPRVQEDFSPFPPILLPQVRRIYPTAVRVIIHSQLVHDPVWQLHHTSTTCAAFDEQGRTLLPVRPEEMPGLCELIHEHCGGGLQVLDIVA